MKMKIKKAKLSEEQKIEKLMAAMFIGIENARQTRVISQRAGVDYINDGIYLLKKLHAEGKIGKTEITELFNGVFPMKVPAYYKL